MDAASISQTLSGTVFDPIVLGGAALVALVLLTGAIARVIELVTHR